MASKKYNLFLGLLTLLSSSAFAQMNGGYDVYDSTVVPSKKMPQQNEFWNNTYNFPAKPRNMWEIGASIGMPAISGDIAAKLPALGFGIHVRKAFGYVFSMRVQYVNAVAQGQNWLPSGNYAKNPVWAKNYNAPKLVNGQMFATVDPNKPYENIYNNFKAVMQDLSFQAIVSLNNMRFHKQKSGVTFYGGAGIGFTAYHTKVNALNENNGNAKYDFSTIPNTGQYEDRGDVRDLLDDMMDDSYESDAETESDRRPKTGKNTVKPSGTVLAGIAFKLSKRINLALEDRHTFVKTDLLDGQRYQESPWGDAVLTSDFDSYNYLSLGLNFNLGGKAVEPLWWINPLDYAYSELNNPKHMKLPKPVFDDADGDGVIDQLDREPNTPAGCPVDSHGVTKDTDGDGVPDCKDKQLITPTECQPVDADGVGKCPEPACCTAIGVVKPGGENNCPADYPSLAFKANSSALSGDAKALLSTVASKLKDNPDCNITITGYPAASKAAQAVAQKRNDAIKKYLVETLGISADRLTFDVSVGGGDANTVDIK